MHKFDFILCNEHFQLLISTFSR